MRPKFAYLAALLCVGCRSEHSRVDRTTGVRDTRPPATPSVAAQNNGLCTTPRGGLRLAVDSVAGMPTNLSLTELRQRCASARPDSLFGAGGQSPAIRFDFVGGTIWAVQNIPDTDTLVVSRPAQFWEAEGDSLRFPDGTLIPRRLGQLRAVDSVGFMNIEYGDDTEGADVTLCRWPAFAFGFDTLPAPADTSLRPFAGISVDDTIRYRRIDMQVDAHILSTKRRLCGTVAERGAR